MVECTCYEVCAAIIVALVAILFVAKGSIFAFVALILVVAYLFCFRYRGLILLGIAYFLLLVVCHLLRVFGHF